MSYHVTFVMCDDHDIFINQNEMFVKTKLILPLRSRIFRVPTAFNNSYRLDFKQYYCQYQDHVLVLQNFSYSCKCQLKYSSGIFGAFVAK